MFLQSFAVRLKRIAHVDATVHSYPASRRSPTRSATGAARRSPTCRPRPPARLPAGRRDGRRGRARRAARPRASASRRWAASAAGCRKPLRRARQRQCRARRLATLPASRFRFFSLTNQTDNGTHMKNYLEPVRASASMRSPRCCCRSPPRPRSRSVVAGRGRTGGRRQRRPRRRPPMLPRRSHRLLGTLEPARQHGRPARRARRSRHHAEPAGNQRVPVQHVGRHASRRRVPATQFGFNVDTGKAVGLPGGTFNVSALQIHGTNLTQRYLQTLQTATGIEANSTTRLWGSGTSSRCSTARST